MEGAAAIVLPGALQIPEGAPGRGWRPRRLWRPRQPEARGYRQGPGRRRPQARSHVHHRLYRPLPARAAGRAGGVARRQADRVDRHASSFRRAQRIDRGISSPAGQGARHRTGPGLRLRRQAHRGSGPGSRAPGQGGGQAGAGQLDARRGVHLGIFSARRRHRGQKRRSQGRHAHGLGFPQLQFRQLGPQHALRRPRPAAPISFHALSAAPGLLSRSGGDRQSFRPRNAHG